jgi:pimeloyl-ACP methyl ester carboxylesterase
MFLHQLRTFPGSRVPAWVRPHPGEPLPEFARRQARELARGLTGEVDIAGASFGGMVLMEMLPHLPIRHAFLIGSVRAPSEIPARYQLLKPLARTRFSFGAIKLLARVTGAALGPGAGPLIAGMLDMAADLDAAFLRWAGDAILRWSSQPTQTRPVHQVHGDRDGILPLRLTHPDLIIPGGGHLISMTHPREVNAFLKQWVA